ncbi:MAG TPA: phosphotransferase [Streptosporangiaceae bacterium]|nr:phosphotransferase [Streptosporangiaceae bacterium]
MATTTQSGVRPAAPGVFPERVLRRWGLDEAPRTVPLTDDPYGRGWRLATGTAAFLLKELTGGRRRHILFRHQVMEALADQGLPVPTAIPARDGRSLVTADARAFALYPWVDGRRRGGLDLSLTQCHELGELLGRVHAALDRLAPPVQQTLLVPTSRADHAVAEIDALLADVAGPAHGPGPGPGDGDGDGDGDDFTALAVRRLRERRALLVALADHQPPELDTATVGYVHGDFHAGSLLYGRTRQVTAIVGWGRLTVGPYGGELVRAAALLFGRDERGLDLERVEAFVRGHAAAFPLDGGQIQAAAHRLWWERLCDIGVLRRRYVDHDAASADVSLLTWWTEHLDRTLDAFAAPYTAASAAPPQLTMT